MEGLVVELAEFAEAWFRDPLDEALPKPPTELLPIWEQFLELHNWRGWDREREMPRLLSIDTIADWLYVTGREPLTSFDLNVVMRLEGAYWDAASNPVVARQTLFDQFKSVAQQEGRVRTVAVNPPKKAK